MDTKTHQGHSWVSILECAIFSIGILVLVCFSACGPTAAEGDTTGDAPNQQPDSSGEEAAADSVPPTIWDVAFSPDGRWVFAGDDGGHLTALFAEDLMVMRTVTMESPSTDDIIPIHRLRWHPGRPILAIATSGGMQGAILDLAADTLRILKGLGDAGGRAIAWSADGTQLGIADYNETFSLWEPDGGFISKQEGLVDKSFVSLDAHPTRDEWLLTSERITHLSGEGGVLDTVRHRSENVLMLCVRWHPSGSFYAVADYGDTYAPYAPLLQFRAPDGTLLKTMEGSKSEYRNLDWSPDGERLATASDKLRIWSKEGALLFAGDSPERLWGVDWSPDGTRIATSDETGHVTLWTAEAQTLLVRSLY